MFTNILNLNYKKLLYILAYKAIYCIMHTNDVRVYFSIFHSTYNVHPFLCTEIFIDMLYKNTIKNIKKYIIYSSNIQKNAKWEDIKDQGEIMTVTDNYMIIIQHSFFYECQHLSFFSFLPIFNCIFTKDFQRFSSIMRILNYIFQRIDFILTSI